MVWLAIIRHHEVGASFKDKLIVHFQCLNLNSITPVLLENQSYLDEEHTDIYIQNILINKRTYFYLKLNMDILGHT